MWSEKWSPSLRQGDVIGHILFPLLGTTFDVLSSTRSLAPQSPERGERVVVPAKPELVVIASHDCEFNEGKRNKMLVARIQAIPGNLGEAEREQLRLSNDLAAISGGSVSGVDSFVVAPIEGVTDEEKVISFGTLTPLPMKMHDELCSLKCAEMRHEERLKFKRKLGWFLGGRGDEDIPVEDRIEPYGT